MGYGAKIMLWWVLNKIQIMMGDNLAEQAIKNSLFRIGLEENRYASEEFMHTFQKSQYLPSKSYSFREISDWSNRRVEEEARRTPSFQAAQNELQAQLGFSKFSFLISRRNQIQREPSENSKTKRYVELSPINVKFSSRPKATLKKANSNPSPKKTKEQGGSFYDSHYQPLSLLYQMRRRERKAGKNKMDQELPFILPQCNQVKLPKTQRVSSIMRLMKKNQQIRIFRQRCNSPEKLDLIKLP